MNVLTSVHALNGVLLAIMLLPGTVAAVTTPIVKYGSYISHQVNVDANGQNIQADKGNEPTIAINPQNPNNIVIGWRKFEPFSSSKQAGYGHSFDGGVSWGTDVLPVVPATERTDPVLDVDSEGNFYYQSMAHGSTNASSIFKSIDGGVTWSEPVYQFIGDKNWLSIDKTGGDSEGNIYSTWRPSGSASSDPNYVPKYFIRSTDGGVSYQEPDTSLPIPAFGFGRIAIGAEGDVYVSGIDETVLSVNSIGIIRSGHYFLKSIDAKDTAASATFASQKIDLGGNWIGLYSPASPNPLGGTGDLQIVTDLSISTMRGNIYMMAHVQAYDWQPDNDPLDVNFVRSTDGGETWSAPVRINDDTPNANAFQWFPMLGVAPNSRIDAVWYDTRNGTGAIPARMSQLYYAYSWDGGLTWSRNQPVTPAFNTHLPNQLVNGEERQADKMGDYTHLLSDNNGAHIAYTATFNGEQDVYYLNVFPDCNENAISDVVDLSQAHSQDADANHVPDECEISVVAGDLDADGDVDKADLALLLVARNRPAMAIDDPKDLDRDGTITTLDARKLILLCTRTHCAVE